MGWNRAKSLTTELSPAPSMLWWLLTGVLMAIAGILLFLIHASGMVKSLSGCNIWMVSLAPSGVWLFLLCLRGWLRGKEVDEHNFLKKEAEHAQKQWEAWTERYLAIVGSCIFLPDKITAGCLHDALPLQYGLIRKIDYLSDRSHLADESLHQLLVGITDALCQLPSGLPLQVTLVTDLPDSGLSESFTRVWTSLFPQRAAPDDITITPVFSMGWVEERLKQPDLTVSLILVMQLCGGDTCSDGLAALLLTSDDVAQKYRLPHPARLLRPMLLDMDKFEEDLTLFLETQTIACRTARVLADSCNWEKVAAPLMTVGSEHGAGWDPAGRMLLEKWCGIPGPAAPWLLTALAADLVTLGNPSLLTLFSSGEERFISTVTSGSEDEHIG
ncbi:type VI secretion protein [Enterobacter cloacae complex sp. 2022EL-00788]|uniref:type VI secretion protein n=1 Tax=Enterobacter cloacae complex sp. 2022EL-00788 TaxID=2996512 RepID=UPI00226F277F|nr:type VI secretion protein [Enterobacter cloacae complex sp. 2022EL-00788]MCY0773743.1 type VI secretion protein [Enterobacter cloacae complex sp. 2022EL-00788]